LWYFALPYDVHPLNILVVWEGEGRETFPYPDLKQISMEGGVLHGKL
jgi:hypothetical protein